MQLPNCEEKVRENGGGGQQRLSDFSIEYILTRAGEKYVERPQCCYGEPEGAQFVSESGFVPMSCLPEFDWLYYTRYRPPRLPRNSLRSGPIKRTPGRLPRVPFTPEQLNTLEQAYRKSMYLSSEEANQLANVLDLSSVRVKIWFQNRRARDRREKAPEVNNDRIQIEENVRF